MLKNKLEPIRTNCNFSLFGTTSSLDIMANQKDMSVPFAIVMYAYLPQHKETKKGMQLLLEEWQVQEMPRSRR